MSITSAEARSLVHKDGEKGPDTYCKGCKKDAPTEYISDRLHFADHQKSYGGDECSASFWEV